MYWLSGAESEKLVKSVEDAYEKIVREGPNPVNLNTNVEEKEVVITPIE
jgi:hypothetical protein